MKNMAGADPKMSEKQRISDDSVNCALGLFNGMIISLPIWGLIYFCLRFFLEG